MSLVSLQGQSDAGGVLLVLTETQRGWRFTMRLHHPVAGDIKGHQNWVRCQALQVGEGVSDPTWTQCPRVPTAVVRQPGAEDLAVAMQCSEVVWDTGCRKEAGLCSAPDRAPLGVARPGVQGGSRHRFQELKQV